MKRHRVNLILVLIFLLVGAVIGRLFFLQVAKGDFYSALAQGQQKIFNSYQGERGKIFFQNGQILATNVYKSFVYICPKEVIRKEETAKKLAELLNLDQGKVLEKTKKENLFGLIKDKLTDEELASLKNLDLEGVYFGKKNWRYYPYQSLASHLVGFVSGEGNGQYGLEGYYDQILKGKKGIEQRGLLSYLEGKKDKLEGADLVLNVDYNIQFMLENLLDSAYQENRFREATIVVVNPNDGRILGLANYPDFNPNQYYQEEDLGIFQNSAIQKIYEPGSVFKPFTMAGGLDEKKITPSTTYLDQGYVQVGGYSIHNYRHRIYGEATMTKVLEDSINTGAIFVQQQLGKKDFLSYVEKFGFFKPTEVDLQGEVCSKNKEVKRGRVANLATASFGQGIEVTPLQLVRAFSAIANGGKLVQPHMVEKIVSSDGIIEIEPEISDSGIISSKTSSKLTAMLVSVVENGFGKPVKIPGYYIAGKTGTAQIPWSILGENKPGYSQRGIGSFIGFAPAFNPRFLILVKFTEPDSHLSVKGSFRQVTKFLLDYYQVPPDY